MNQQDIKKIIGHDRALTYFNRLSPQDYAHAYIFSGKEHVGKTTVVAEILSRLMGVVISPDVVDGLEQHLDVTVLDLSEGKRDISIEQVRNFISALMLTPAASPFTIGIIRQSERLSLAAAQALLKILEEPAARARIFLLSSDASQLLATIRSRCATVHLYPVPAGQLREFAESLGADRHEAASLSRWAFGCPGLLISYLRNREAFDTILENHKRALGILNAPLWQRLAALNADDVPYDQLAQSFQLILRDAALIQANSPESAVMHEFLDEIRNFNSGRTPQQIVEALAGLGEYQQARAANISPQLFLENILLNV